MTLIIKAKDIKILQLSKSKMEIFGCISKQLNLRPIELTGSMNP